MCANVADFGAIGNGVVNDQPAIGAAFSATPTGSIVCIPPGTYLMNTRLIVSKKITILGVGPGATTLLINEAAFQVDASGVEIRDVNILGSAGVQTRLALQTKATAAHHTDWTFRNVTFDGVGLPITRIGSIDANGATVTSGSDLASNVRILDCEFTNYTPDATLHINGTHNVLIQNNWLHDGGTDQNAGDAIKVKSDSTGVQIADNLIERSARDGIDTHDGKFLTITGNVIRDCGVHGIEAKFTTTSGLADKTIVANNRVYNCGLATAAPAYQLAVDYVNAVGNIAHGCNGYGFRCGESFDLVDRWAKGAVFVGNLAVGCTSDGFLFNKVEDSVLVGNVAMSNGGKGYNVQSALTRRIRMSDNVAIGNTGTNYDVPAVPSTATSTGGQGEIRYDSSHVYICTATDTWRRAAIGSW